MLIGITGGIGAGKSVVSRLLRLKGYPVYDCDSRAKWLMENDPYIIDQLIHRFGAEAMLPSGNLNRPFIASKVFTIDDDRLWLNDLVHGAVRDDLRGWIERMAQKLCFVESAIMVSSGLDKMCDSIWLVDAPLELRKQRALRRGGVTEENLDLRIRSQRLEFDRLPADKIERIENDGRWSVLMKIGHLLKKNY